MDSHDRRSRQSNAPGFAGPSSTATGVAGLLHQGQTVQSAGQYPTVSGGAGDRFQVQPGALPSAASAGRSSNMPSYSYGANAAGAYGDLSAGSTLQSASLQYPAAGTDYAASQDASRRAQQSSQQHGAHSSQQQPVQHPNQHQTPQHQSQTQYHGMYGQQGSPSSPYDSVQQYPPARQSAAIEVLSNQFAGVTPTYYVAGEGGPTSAPNTGIAAQGVQPQYNPMTYTTQSPVGRDSLASAYAAGMTDPSQASGSQPAYGQQTGFSHGSQTAELDNAFGQYQEALRRTFETIRDGNLTDAGNTVLGISEWLLGNAEVLGLVRDDESTHTERLKLWNEFNMCWLAMLQRQKEMTTESLESGQRLAPPRNLLDYEQMENMGKELVRLCDSMEKHGLVDYEMGVWEEDIISLLTQCLDMIEDQGASGVPMPTSSNRR